jgi:hypothetical protein
MSIEHSPTRRRGPSPFSVADPSLNIDEFCAAEKFSRALLYKLWKEGKGPDISTPATRDASPTKHVNSGDASAKPRPSTPAPPARPNRQKRQLALVDLTKLSRHTLSARNQPVRRFTSKEKLTRRR